MYLIEGNDRYLAQVKVKKIIKELNSDYVELDGETCTLEQVEDYLLTPPFLEDKKTLIINNAYFFSRSKTNNKNFTEEDFLKLIKSGFENELILVVTKNKVDQKKKVYKDNRHEIKLVQIEEMNDKSFASFTKNVIIKQKIDISADAFEILINSCNNNVEQVISNLKKMQLYGKKITMENIFSLISETHKYVAFDLTNAIFRGDISTAIKIRTKLLEMGEDDIAIIALIASNMRSVLKIKLAMENGINPNELAKIASINPYVIRKNIGAAERMNLKEINNVIEMLFDFDNKTKTSDDYTQVNLDMLIIKMCEMLR